MFFFYEGHSITIVEHTFCRLQLNTIFMFTCFILLHISKFACDCAQIIRTRIFAFVIFYQYFSKFMHGLCTHSFVAGMVHVIDSRRILVTDFNYDGMGPGENIHKVHC